MLKERITLLRNQIQGRRCNFCKPLAVVTLLLVCTTFLGAYWVAPTLIKQHLNQQVLASMGAYSGRIEKVTLQLSSFSYVLHGMHIERKNSQAQHPFFAAEQLIISISLISAFNGKLDVNAHLHAAELNFIDSPSEPRRQTGEGTNWLNIFQSILPTSVNTLTLDDGTIRFINNDTKPQVSLTSHNIRAQLTNLSSATRSNELRSATGYFQSSVEQSGELFAKAEFDPDHFDNFHLKATAKSIQLEEFNEFFEAYAHLDFKSGYGDLLIELFAEQGNLNGYIKPFVHDIQIISWKQDVEDQHDNPLKLIWELSLEVVQNIITTLGTDELATKIELSGDISRAQVQSWPAFGEAIKNMLLNSVKKKFDVTGDTNDG